MAAEQTDPNAAQRHRVIIMVQRIARILDGKDVISVGMAIQTVLGNVLIELAPDHASALRGLDSMAADIRTYIDARFAQRPTEH